MIDGTRVYIKPPPFGAVLDARHFRPEIARIIEVVSQEAPPMESDDPVVITSGLDHHERGLHPQAKALDFRGHDIAGRNVEERRRIGSFWACRVQARLGADYDALWEEHRDPRRDHLHVEYDPKPRQALMPGFYARIKGARRGGTR